MNKQKKEDNMDNTENSIKTDCECSMNYESEYHDAMIKIARLIDENFSLKNIIKELSKLI